jgi:SP family general alpha glucoside:H+ symporter-like MFS transporter
VVLGIAASVGKSTAASLAQAALGLIVSVLFTLGPAFVFLIPTIV